LSAELPWSGANSINRFKPDDRAAAIMEAALKDGLA